ncbi:multinuclear nonheme iron-dependent oxidase [Hymenobacter chitinivorans]|uniref:Uncharacterized protein (UPF0276 family) n=1 Tax=Hymenobacter chitinivorans DSM 11115 TaxID=1121954 RepID=A0A2M9BSU0_9BACT|nr:DUF692 family multinuclear iron-containing protein [Hymenobacter chitinivorans]PJJ61015.1 uncharacterized protein (UPF0276 family) [Hymenobacter chitinivorans DSM 11115]
MSTPAAAAEPGILATLACNLDADMLSASFPLLEQGRVEALEWSFDALFWAEQIPEWFTELLRAFAAQNRLVGHGVYFSLLSGRWTPEQQQWLSQLRKLAQQFRFDHITEHFGFFTGQNFHAGAPLPIPYTSTALRLGQDRLCRIQEACGCPVGLENLAFAYSLDEVRRHGEFLAQLVEPVNGFLILDLHNLFCQLHNFGVSYEELIQLYPLERVREIHISGGSWEESGQEPGRQVRRDTHDGAVPDEVFELLSRTLPRCPNLKFVVLEQLGNALQTEPSRAQFRRDFGRLEAMVHEHRAQAPAGGSPLFLPQRPLPTGPVAEDARLHEQQQQLTHILETAPSYDEARQRLAGSSLAHSDWQIEQWAPHMLETALRIAQKWK